MSGLDVLGALAAASQLVEQGLKVTIAISNLYSKVRNAPESIHRQSIQVDQLIDIASLIKQNPSLQTPLVDAILRTCTAEAANLHEVLTKISATTSDGTAKRIWKAVDGVAKEKSILALFAKLEQGKSSLALCIETIDSALLHTIHLDFITVRKVVSDISKELPAIRDNFRNVTTVLDTLPIIADDVTELRETLPIIASKVSTVYDELPAISGAVAAIHDELLPIVQSAMQQLMLDHGVLHAVAEPAPIKGYTMVPYARNSQFIGREDYLEDLCTGCENHDRHNRVALVGLGGIGKSQVALEYAYRRQERSPQVSIFWINAHNASRFRNDYVHIGRIANVPGIRDHGSDVERLVKDWLSSKESGTWTMIVDNADDPQVFSENGENGENGKPLVATRIGNLLPQTKNGSIIFTSRNKKVGIRLATANGIILLPKMDPKDANELLNIRSGELTIQETLAEELLEALDYLPLAVSHAGSYMAENSVSVIDYLQMYKESERSKIELLSEDFEDLAIDSQTSSSVATTWSISFEQITKSNIRAADLLAYMACLDEQPVPKSLLPLHGSSVQTSNALGILKAYSLITASQNNNVFTMHRLVYIATRNWLQVNTRFMAWAGVCLVSVSEKFPSGESETLDQCDRYLPHAQRVLGYDGVLDEQDFSQAVLAEKLSRYFKNRGAHNTAMALAEQASKWRRVVASDDSNKNYYMIVEDLPCLSRDDQTSEKYKQVLPRCEQWYNKWVESLGLENTIAQRSLSNFTASLYYQRRYGTVEQLHRRVLARQEQTQGPEHPSTLKTVCTIAYSLLDQRKFSAAENLARRALTGYGKSPGALPWQIHAASYILAAALKGQDKFAEAEKLARRTSIGREEDLAFEDYDTICSIIQLARILRRHGKYDEASIYYQSASVALGKPRTDYYDTTRLAQQCSEEYSSLLEEMKLCVNGKDIDNKSTVDNASS